MSNQIFSVEAQCRSVQTKGMNQVKVTFDSQENLSDISLATIAKWHGKAGHLVFLSEEPNPEDLAKLPSLKADDFGKSPAERLHGKIWKLWKTKQDRGEEVPSSDQFYRDMIEKFCNYVDRLCA
jgi:hypothetical protein